MNEKRKNFLKKKIIKQILIVISILIAVVFLVLLRPDKNTVIKDDKIPDKKTVIDEFGDLSELKPMEKNDLKGALSDVPLKRDFVSKKIGGNNDKDSVENKDDDLWSKRKVEKDGKMSNDFSQHQGMVVQAREKIESEKANLSSYPVVDPDFSNLHPLNYRGLKKVYTYFRLKETFPKVVLEKLNGAAVEMIGAVMPVDQIPEDGVFAAFWLSNPVIVLAGCVFCNPPTLADIVYVYKNSGETPFKFEREKLFKQVVLVKITGRLFFGPETIKEQTFLFSILANDVKILN